MHLVIVHYHLNRGGVTQVIFNHLRALARTDAFASEIQGVTLLYGGRRQGWPGQLDSPLPVPLELMEWPALEYDSEPAQPAAALSDELKQLLQRAGLTPDRTLLHVHNHALGKNIAWTASIPSLAQAGYRLLLQIHDFAEDFRPVAYRRLIAALADDRPADVPRLLYPQASHIHYAVLNGRDQAVLAAAGIARSHLHYLPNPVAGPGPPADPSIARKRLAKLHGLSTDRRLVVYPVRGIRRKNLGELLLWAAVDGSTTYGVTLSPLNVLEQPSYQRWRRLAAELQLPVAFGLGEPGGLSLAQSLAAADAVITTSVAEGFGMALLESWLAGCPLIGRDLPEITDDFAQQGIQFPWLAPRLVVPLSWIDDLSTFHRRWADQVNRVLSDYSQPHLPPDVLERGFDQLTTGKSIDFANLDAEHQAAVVHKAKGSPDHRHELLDANPLLRAAANISRATAADFVGSQAARIAQQYSLEVTGHRLLDLYRRLAESPVGDVISIPRGQLILQRYLDPVRLHLIRLET